MSGRGEALCSSVGQAGNAPAIMPPCSLKYTKLRAELGGSCISMRSRFTETFSKRPYVLGQACDGTIDSCVHGLFIEWCRNQGHDPQELYHAAYPDAPPYSADMQASLLNEARLQGTTFPQHWGAKENDGLIASLSEINNHSLVDVVTEAQERGQPKQNAYERYGPQSPTPEREAGRKVERDRS